MTGNRSRAAVVTLGLGAAVVGGGIAAAGTFGSPLSSSDDAPPETINAEGSTAVGVGRTTSTPSTALDIAADCGELEHIGDAACAGVVLPTFPDPTSPPSTAPRTTAVPTTAAPTTEAPTTAPPTTPVTALDDDHDDWPGGHDGDDDRPDHDDHDDHDGDWPDHDDHDDWPDHDDGDDWPDDDGDDGDDGDDDDEADEDDGHDRGRRPGR